MSEAETSTTTTDSTTDTDTTESEATGPDGANGEAPTINLGPTYEEIQQELEKSPETYEYGKDEDQDYVDRDSIDFDPADGLFSGTGTDDDGSDTKDTSDADSSAAEAPETAETTDTAETTEGDDRPKPGPGPGKS